MRGRRNPSSGPSILDRAVRAGYKVAMKATPRMQPDGPTPAELAKRIRLERLRVGLSQSETGRRLGISQQAYAYIERAGNPRLDTLCALKNAGLVIRNILPELFE